LRTGYSTSKWKADCPIMVQGRVGSVLRASEKGWNHGTSATNCRRNCVVHLRRGGDGESRQPGAVLLAYRSRWADGDVYIAGESSDCGGGLSPGGGFSGGSDLSRCELHCRSRRRYYFRQL